MRWQIRLLRNSVFALLPGQQLIRRVKRAAFPYPADIDAWTLEQGLRMLEMLQQVGVGPQGRCALEIGTGWKPLIPLLFYLAGFKRILLVDAQRLLDVSLLRRIAGNLAGFAPRISSRLGLEEHAVRQRLVLDEEVGFDQALRRFGFEYLAPTDIRATQIPTGSVDVVISRAVLEHIPLDVIRSIFRECSRILAPNGRMCHVVDNSDHWSHGDKTLSSIHFLRYSERTWRWFALNTLDYQNRLRHSDYCSILKEAGFRIDLDLSEPDRAAMRDLAEIPVDPRFINKGPEDLAILTSYLVASSGSERTKI